MASTPPNKKVSCNAVSPSPIPSQASNTSCSATKFSEMDFLCKFLGISGDEEDAFALANFLVFMGTKSLDDLACIEEGDFEDYQMPLSRTMKRKLLLVADFMSKGGSLKEIESISALRAAKNGRASSSALSKLESADEAVIHLNVGGYKFTTTKDTLCSVHGSLLEAMFSGRHENPARRDKDGTYVIDRDGAQFQHILAFLRVGAIISLPQDETSKEELVVEADYYGLKDLVHAIRMPQVDTSRHLPEEVLSMRQAEDNLRKAFVNGIAKCFEPYRGLLSLFSRDDGVQPLPFVYEPTGDTRDLLMGSLRKNPSPGTPVTVTSLEEFQSNFNREHPNLLHRLTPVLLEESVVIAGGSILRALTSSPDVRTADWWGEKSDVDLFLYCNGAEEANRVARRIFYALAMDNERWVIVRSRGVITMHNWVEDERDFKVDLKVQIVLRIYDSPAEVLLGFDCDCCCCAYDGRDVWVTPRCIRALQTGVNILNPLHAWPNKPSYELRLAKYAFRGFPVLVPGLDRNRINYDEIRSTNLRELKGLARLLKITFEMDASPLEKTSWNHWLRREERAPRTEAFPLPPLRVKSLYIHARNDLSDADLTTRGMGSGYDDGFDGALIVPEPYGPGIGEGSDAMWWWGATDDFPLASVCRDSAWEGIEDAADSAPEGVPALLVDSWGTEKRSREYLNSEMDSFDLENIYYGHAYEKAA